MSDLRTKIQIDQNQGQVVAERTDTDFCTHFRDLNPYYYVIWVCPHCGFAAHEERFFTLVENSRLKIKKFLEGRQVKLDLSGARTWEQAVTSHKLAIFYAGMATLPASHIASLELRLAWLYREKEMVDEEQEVLIRAAGKYQEAFMREQMPIGNLTEVMLMYLIGELFRRIGHYDEALSYLSKVVGNPQAKNERRVLEMAREAWQMARDAKKAAGGRDGITSQRGVRETVGRFQAPSTTTGPAIMNKGGRIHEGASLDTQPRWAIVSHVTYTGAYERNNPGHCPVSWLYQRQDRHESNECEVGNRAGAGGLCRTAI